MLSAFLWSCLEEYLALDSHESGSLARYEDVPFQLHINGLKVLASETAFEVVNELISVVGLRHGYTRSEEAQLERTFRDLRSAALMYANDRLLVANGKMALFGRRVRLLGERDDNETNAMFFGPSTREG